MNAQELLSPQASDFLARLHHEFEGERIKILNQRSLRARTRDLERLSVPLSNAHLDSDWTVASIPDALKVRTVEITGPAEPKMIINALNSSADVFMADFEDSLSPTWNNIVQGHIALQAALRRTLEFKNENGKLYRIETTNVPTLVVRPRGWHLSESDFQVGGQPMSASLFDFGLYIFYGGHFGRETGRGPYFYLPKIESALEARLWANVFSWAESALDIPPNSIRATVLIETLPAALAMEEILFELRHSVVGLNAGRWDYLFSVIKTLSGTSKDLVFPDRGRLTMDVPFLRQYSEKIVDVCRRRGASPMGGMSALIPSRKDVAQNERALKLVRLDKEREARQGFVGTWVAHPDLIAVARAAFEASSPNADETNLATSLARSLPPKTFNLLPVNSEEPFLSHRPTEAGVDINVDVSLRYLAHWLNGMGAVAIHGLMEDAATAEISRAQLWQWRKKQVILDTGNVVTASWITEKIRTFRQNLSASLDTKLKTENPLSIAESRLREAEELLINLVLDDSEIFPAFLTLSAMDRLKHNTAGAYDDRSLDREI